MSRRLLLLAVIAAAIPALPAIAQTNVGGVVGLKSRHNSNPALQISARVVRIEQPATASPSFIPMPKTVQETKADDAATLPSEERNDQRFTRYYGEYGGIGNRGGRPVDKLDAAYKQHDEGYDRNGRFDGKSDAVLLEKTPAALTSGHVGGEGIVKGPIAFEFFGSVMPSVFRVKPNGSHGSTMVVPVPNGGTAFTLYKGEQAVGLVRSPGQVTVEAHRLAAQGRTLRKKLEKKIPH